MSVSEQIIKSGIQHVLESQPKNTCVMLDDDGKEVNITKDMVVTVLSSASRQCRNVKN